MGIGPAMGIPAVLEQCQLTVLEDIDVFEINKAFALQATWCVDVLKIDPSKVNPNGGAIALGHPLGCTGTRQIATLLRKLHRKKTAIWCCVHVYRNGNGCGRRTGSRARVSFVTL
jgi:acetyl-CoA acyltransferase 1